MLKVGVIGYGRRISHVLQVLKSFKQGVEITAIADPKFDEIKTSLGEAAATIRFYDSADKMLAKEELNGVAIGTRCSLHTQFACEVARTKLPLFLEKPISTNMKDLRSLHNSFKNYQNNVVVSFPLRLSPLVQTAREIIESGKIGSVEHVQAFNNVTYGDTYFMNWYRDEKETGGLFLQKATHDFDYINHLLGSRRPQMIAAMASKQVYKGDMPAGLECNDCPKPEDCMESPFHRFRTRGLTKEVTPNKLKCAFASDTGNEDSSSALIRYDTGMHVSYTQNFFARRKAGNRGARLVGYKGTLEFDWYKNELKVFSHHTGVVSTHNFEDMGGHGGGDEELALNFIRIMQGREESKSPIQAGILSALMCLKAKESADTNTFQEIGGL